MLANCLSAGSPMLTVLRQASIETQRTATPIAPTILSVRGRLIEQRGPLSDNTPLTPNPEMTIANGEWGRKTALADRTGPRRDRGVLSLSPHIVPNQLSAIRERRVLRTSDTTW